MSVETRRRLFHLVKEATIAAYPSLDITPYENEIINKFEEPKEVDFKHNVAFPCHSIAKYLNAQKPPELNFNEFTKEISKNVGSKLTPLVQEHDIVRSVDSTDSYLNFFFKPAFLGLVVPTILDGSFLQPLPKKNENVMIEYSQPNTHKTFHVGHMRNAALGNSLVNIYEYNGYHVDAVNYIGDVGAHIAKCLWYYLYFLKKTTVEEFEQIDFADESAVEAMVEADRPKDMTHVEWLGSLYQSGYDALDITNWTSLAHPGFVSAKILSIDDHPNNPLWKVLIITTDEEAHNKYRIVCGGKGYKLNDIVAYAPVGSRKAGRVVGDHNFKGTISQGLILSEKELDDSKTNKDQIHIFPPTTVLGMDLTEIGRREGIDLDKELKIASEIQKRNTQVKHVLSCMEKNLKNITLLWKVTRKWSIDDFQKIYQWVGCRFDHFFHESDVGDESKQMVQDAYKEGKLIMSEGAIGADLTKYKLNFCVLLTSAGNGLYATKDLALAKRKFEEYKVDRSIYVVDASQSLHFQQVFKTLEVLGFKQASKCYHLAYGLVVLPDGKMSSRKGNIIMFSQLRDQLSQTIYKDYLAKYEGQWDTQEIQTAVQRIAVSTIKYGMLNQDNKKDIVFSMKDWTAKSGNTGPYLMYAYTRTRSIILKVGEVDQSLVDFSLLTAQSEISVMSALGRFPSVVQRAASEYKAQSICSYLYGLAKLFSTMYEEVSVMKAENEALKVTRLNLVDAVGLVLRKGLNILGIQTIERM
ncbi:arginine tRS [Acrasis kona]|uniref:arginine--tRNA ligase n=1 Tax=Acrasis kona TaxID=1008807 RepID=A0AAW2ZJD5_9EUKA